MWDCHAQLRRTFQLVQFDEAIGSQLTVCDLEQGTRAILEPGTLGIAIIKDDWPLSSLSDCSGIAFAWRTPERLQVVADAKSQSSINKLATRNAGFLESDSRSCRESVRLPDSREINICISLVSQLYIGGF